MHSKTGKNYHAIQYRAPSKSDEKGIVLKYVTRGIETFFKHRHIIVSTVLLIVVSAIFIFYFSFARTLFLPLNEQVVFAYVPRVDPVTSDCAPFIATVFPVTQAPIWGAMYTERQWNRTFEQLTDQDFVLVPPYQLSELTMQMADLLLDRFRNMRIITEKLFYSTRYFGRANLDSGEFESYHAGIDIKLALNTPLRAIAGGTVHVVGANNILGSFIIIKHCLPKETFFSVYGHMKRQYVDEGDALLPGAVIGTVGLTGRTSGPHLHLQVDRYQRGEKGKHIPFKVLRKMSPEQLNRYTVNPIDFIADH